MLRGRTSTPPRPWPMQKLFSTSTSVKLLRRKGSPVSKPMATRNLLLRALATIFGVALLTYLIWRIGPSELSQDVSRLGWGGLRSPGFPCENSGIGEYQSLSLGQLSGS